MRPVSPIGVSAVFRADDRAAFRFSRISDPSTPRAGDCATFHVSPPSVHSSFFATLTNSTIVSVPVDHCRSDLPSRTTFFLVQPFRRQTLQVVCVVFQDDPRCLGLIHSFDLREQLRLPLKTLQTLLRTEATGFFTSKLSFMPLAGISIASLPTTFGKRPLSSVQVSTKFPLRILVSRGASHRQVFHCQTRR